MKLIKLSSDHYIIVDDSEIKEGDIFIHPNNVIERASRDLDGRGISKIIASTNKLNGVIFLNLSEVKELLGEVDVEKKATSYCENWEFERILGTGSDGLAHDSYVAGYNQALEDNKDRKYTKQDMVEWAMCMIAQYVQGNTNIWNRELLRQSLPQLRTEWDVEFVNGKLKLK